MGDKYIIPPVGTPNNEALAEYFGMKHVVILNSKKNPYDGATGLQRNYTKDQPIATSILGTPVYSDLSLMGCAWSDTNKPQNADGTYPVTTLPSGASDPQNQIYMNIQTVIITLSQPYKVVETEIQGRDGVVYEYIGKGAASITIQGILVGQNGVYPREDAYAMKQWADAPVSKRVVSWWLQNLGIDNVVVKNIDMPQVAGGYSYQPFNITASADAPVELRTSQPIQTTV